MDRRSVIVALAGLALSGCGHTTAPIGKFADVAAGGEPLRSQFNQGADRVRLVLLVSPT